jgi:lysozyme
MMDRTLLNLLYGALAVGVVWFAVRTGQNRARAISADAGSESGDSFQFPNTSALLSFMPAVTQQIAASTLAFLRAREGYRATAYSDAGGYSIGFGHFLGAKPVPATITLQQAESWLSQDAQKAADAVIKLVRVPLTQNQFDALVSFVYNLGEGALSRSTLLKKLNAGDYAGAAQEFRRWVYSGGTVLAGLVTRRAAERDLFNRA